MAGWNEELEQVSRRKEKASELGGPEAVAKQHARGRLTCRERVDLLLDPGSFVEVGLLNRGAVETLGRPPREVPADGVVAGWGTIGGRKVFVAADDGTILAGARGHVGGVKVSRLQRMAYLERVPFISLLEASASRVQDNMTSKFGGGYSAGLTGFRLLTAASGTIPQVTAMMGGCFGGAAMNALLTDFVPIVKGAFMGLSGPPVVRGGTGQEPSAEELGGSHLHTAITGQADYEAADDPDCIRAIKEYLSYFPQSCYELPPRVPTEDGPDRRCDELLEIVPTNLRRAYDVQRVIRSIVDGGKYLSIKAPYGRNLVTCLARLDGRPVGIIANQPMYLVGCLDWRACIKATRFVELCDAYNIPIISLVDTPGFLVGVPVEREAALRYGMRFVMAASQATVPWITVVMRKAYGLAWIAMGSQSAGADLIYAWPTASIAMMGPEAAVGVMYVREIASASDPAAFREERERLFREGARPWLAAEQGHVDSIIDPRDTRRVLAQALAATADRARGQLHRKHPIWP